MIFGYIDRDATELAAGWNKIHFYGWGESLSDTLIDNFQIQYEYFDVTDGTNEYVAELSNPMLSFTVLSTDEFGIEIECTRQGYSPKSLYIYFNREP